MVIDAHTHLFGKWLDVQGTSPRQLADSLKSVGVDKAFVFTLDGFFGNCPRHNDELARLAAECPEELIAFGTVDPYQGEEAVKETRRCITELGMKGMKFHPWLQAFSLSIPAMDDIAEECGRLGVPISFHDGTPPYASTPQTANLADSHPETKIILGHSGLHDQWPDAVRWAERLPNLYLTTCGTPFVALQKMAERVGPDRILFGTDAGFSGPEMVLYHLDNIHALPISKNDKEKILGGNAARLVGI